MMSSSPTNGATKSKINLSVASLLSGANGDRLAATDKQSISNTCTVNAEHFYRDVSTCSSTISRNLPTVANSELLYKTIPSRSISPSQMPPLAPTRPQMVMTRAPVGLVRPVSSSVGYTVQQIYEQHGFSGYPNVNNPLTNIKTLTNTVTVATTHIHSSQYQVKTMSNIQQTPSSNITFTQGHNASLPASSIVCSRLSNSPVSSTTYTGNISSMPLVANGDMTISNVNTDDSSSYKCEVVSEGNVGEINIQDCSSYDTDLVAQMSVMANSSTNEVTYTPALPTTNGSKSIQNVAVVPKGWNRIIEKGVIIYISPNKSRIRTCDDMIEYLESERTCKCGLECPVRPRELFNFDPKVSSKLSYTENETCEREIYCDTCKEFDTLMATALSQKRVRRGRRRGRTKSSNEDEEKPASDRKKILLTGASPLEMFQSGMQAINALSDSQFKNYSMDLDENKQTASLLNKFSSRPVASSTLKQTNNTTVDNSAPLIQMSPNTLPGGASVSLSTDATNVHSTSLPTDTIPQNTVPYSDPSSSDNENNQLSNVISSSSPVPSFEIPETSSQYITTQSVVTSPQPTISLQPGNSISSSIVSPPISSYESSKRTYQSTVNTTSFQPATSSADISQSELNRIAADIIKTESVDMPFPSSLMGNKKRVRKTNTKGRPRTKVPDTYVDVPGEPIIKQYIKKVIPDADIKKASELQPNEYLQHSAYMLKQASMQQSSPEIVPLKTIHSETFGQRPQAINSSSLPNESKTTMELQDIYKSLHVSVMAPHSTYDKVTNSNLTSSYSTKTDISPSYDSPPPNRTVSSTNQLPEALVNQLGYKYSSSNGFSHENNKTISTSVPNIQRRSPIQQSTNTNVPIVSAMQEKMLPSSIPVTAASTTSCSIPSDGNNQPLNRPLQNVNISPNMLSSTTQSSQPDAGQQMLLLQFVTQNADQSNNTVTKVNAPIVRAYSMSHPQAYVQQGQPKYVLMGKSNASQTLATLAMQSKSNALSTPPVDATKHALQIQGLVPVQTNASQLSPRGVSVSHAVPVQYVTTVNPGLSVGNQNSEQSYPLMQYIPPTRPAHVSYVYPCTNSTVIRPTIASITNNYVRIAPAMQPIATTVNIFDIEKKKKEQELLESLQEQLLIKNSVISNISQDIVSVTPTFLTGVPLSSSKVSQSDSLSSIHISPTSSDINSQTTINTTQVLVMNNDYSANVTYNNNAGLNSSSINMSSNMHTVYSTSDINRDFSTKILPTHTYSPITTTCIPSAVICSPQSLHSSTTAYM